jgi:nucleoside phosphorylase
MKRARILSLTIVVVLSAVWVFPASARIPLAVLTRQGDTLEGLARDHHVNVGSIFQENPQLKNAGALTPGQWIFLPPEAQMPKEPVFAVSAPSETELKFVLQELADDRVYRIMGREYHYASWMGVPIVAFATGGSMDNPAIAVTLAADNFNVKRFCYQGIGGAGHDVNIGDVLVATGVVPGSGHGNVAPLQTPLGDVVVGTFWSYYYGEPVIGDNIYEGRLVLTPETSFMEKVLQTAEEVALPVVNQEVADYLSFFYGEPWTVYQSQVRVGWTSTGPFVSSDLYLSQLETRSQILASLNGLSAPEFIAVDMEDYGAIHAAVEAGVDEWCVIRSTVDLARERIPGESSYHGVPWEQQDDPSQPWAWLDENKGTYGYFEDWDYFYRLPYLIMKEIVVDWGLN